MMLQYLKLQSFEHLLNLSARCCLKNCKYVPRNVTIRSRFTTHATAEPASDVRSISVETDADVGATEFLSDHRGFSGILRHRYADFLVNEISADNEMVRLSNLGFCEKTIRDFFKFTQLLPKHQTNLLMDTFEGKNEGEIEINVSSLSSQDVNNLCDILRKTIFRLEVYTKKTDLGKVIVLNPSSDSITTYTNFVLFKENLASMDSCQIISRLLRKKSGDLNLAGMKDKRAVTFQRVTAKNVKVEKLIELNDKLRGMKIGNIFYDTKPLKLGHLYGNHFNILIREIDADPDEVETALENFKEKGFINYYGLQRFGRSEQPILAIGQKLFARDWKGAVETILKPNDRQKLKPDVLKCREVWWETRDAQKALFHLRNKFTRVGLLLRGLSKHDNDFEKALEWLPTDILKLFLHSYCSYIWNQIVSRRISEYGVSPVLGDLVIPKDLMRNHENLENKLQVVDQEMLRNDDFSMYNVVLPMPGVNMKLPENKTAKWYSEFLVRDGLNLHSFHSENPRYLVEVRYRPILRKPENVAWSFLSYDDPDQDLVLTDYDKLQGLVRFNKEPVGFRKALKLEFSLLSSSYATSAIREITRRCVTTMMGLKES